MAAMSVVADGAYMAAMPLCDTGCVCVLRKAYVPQPCWVLWYHVYILQAGGITGSYY